MANKMTYAQAIDMALAIETFDNEEARERLEALKAQLAKRGSAKKGLTKVQKENEVLKEQMLGVLEAEVDGMTATEIGNALAVTCQKASALLGQLVKEEKVVKAKDGKVTRFVLA